MKYLTILLFCVILTEGLFGQSVQSRLHFGKYEGIEIRYLKHESDTSRRVDRMNENWGKKSLTIDSNGTFLLEFPVPYPRTPAGDLNRLARGRWVKVNDTLILNSYHPHSDFIKVKERKVNREHIQVKLRYTYKGKRYYPGLSVSINNEKDQMINTKRKKWTYIQLDTIKSILIAHWVSPTSSDREWIYKPLNINSNSFVITVSDKGEDDNFVVEDYKLLIVGSSLVQIDKLFWLRQNLFKATNFR